MSYDREMQQKKEDDDWMVSPGIDGAVDEKGFPLISVIDNIGDF